MYNNKQHGFSLLSFILGGLLGLIIAAAVAFYITKAEVPFVDRFARQTQLSAPPNWDPNQALQRNSNNTTTQNTTAPSAATTDPVAVATVGNQPAANGDPSTTTPEQNTQIEPQFYVQAGAFSASSDAEAQRARISMLGEQAQITQVQAAGQIVHRVRIGPFVTRSAASAIHQKLVTNGINASIISSQ